MNNNKYFNELSNFKIKLNYFIKINYFEIFKPIFENINFNNSN